MINLEWISKFFQDQEHLKKEITPSLPLKNITLTGRIDHIRKCGGKMFFLILRTQEKTLQCVFREDLENLPDLTRHKIKEFSKTPPESIVKITGNLVASPVEIKSSTIKFLEFIGSNLEVISLSVDQLPIQVYKPDALLETRLEHRILDLRSQQNQIIFQLQSQIQSLASQYFIQEGFTWLSFPKILGATSESGAESFRVDYFGETAFLAQSPQLHKQMAINSGFQKVFTIGPVFRAEKSHTSRHLTEFTGIDFEMEIEERSEVLRIAYNLIQSIFQKLKANNSDKFELWERITEKPFQHPLIPLKPVIIPYQEATKLLEEQDYQIESPEDFNNPDLFKLSEIIKGKYQSDLFILDQFPASSRPFYTQTSPDNPEISLGYDLIFKGKEILSGAQRISDYDLLVKKVKEANLEGLESSLKDYLESFKYGSHPHAGGGFGLERIMWAYLELPNIRNYSVFPRDPSLLRP